MTLHRVQVFDEVVEVACKQGVVSIQNDASLAKLLAKPGGAKEVAKAVKSFYKQQFQQELKIETGSLHAEILGHVYPDRMMKVFDDVKLPAVLDRGIDKILTRTAVIDCGETGKDGNRFVWDLLHKHAYALIEKL